ncbi:MAG: TetM/TetW/TetO/TetS family tetracycline resistance ribosomal protection protein [Epulopiscium sp.]|nr:TetM/TetW/TetO/TetS family tetracycline resistance ribosomal protection protein [Candidatus Epulonipiscium sp.]
MRKTIGILAHVDAGKTTFAEQLLYHGKSIKKRGRVDHKNAFLDHHNIEKDRGITVFSEQGTFVYKNVTYYLLDTPGHMDFSSEMERAIQVMDYAIIIISGVEGIQGHTETVWQLLRKYQVPTFFFINKIDRVGSNVQEVLKEIHINITKNVCFIYNNVKKEEMKEELIEFMAERNEYLFELYIEGKYDKNLWFTSMKEMIKQNKIFPCFSGSALQDQGIADFLEVFHDLTFTEYTHHGEFGGRVYKIRYDKQGVRMTYIKALQGTLKVRDEIRYGNQEHFILEKVTQIREYNGCKFQTVNTVSAGQLFAVTGLTRTKAGDGIGNIQGENRSQIIPTMRSKVLFDKALHPKDVLYYFRILEEEDPALNVEWNETLQEIQIHVMGLIQLEVLKKVVDERFGLEIYFGPCEILYKETICRKVTGCGHFEPLGHYAEVHFLLEPAKRNTGILFESRCHPDDLSVGYQNLIRSHLYERDHKGILTGSPITDLKITLLTGRSHNKHTSGGDFREATYRALRQGLEKTENILLEPYYRFKFKVELDQIGKILTDITKLHGTFKSPQVTGHKAIITGRGPVAMFMNYTMDFIAFTQGKGSMSFIFDGYDFCHNTEEVIKKKKYNKNADLEYTSSSIFCSKGQSYTIKGSKVEEHMHCL